jgi:hypothetical protein
MQLALPDRGDVVRLLEVTLACGASASTERRGLSGNTRRCARRSAFARGDRNRCSVDAGRHGGCSCSGGAATIFLALAPGLSAHGEPLAGAPVEQLGAGQGRATQVIDPLRPSPGAPLSHVHDRSHHPRRE